MAPKLTEKHIESTKTITRGNVNSNEQFCFQYEKSYFILMNNIYKLISVKFIATIAYYISMLVYMCAIYMQRDGNSLSGVTFVKNQNVLSTQISKI